MEGTDAEVIVSESDVPGKLRRKRGKPDPEKARANQLSYARSDRGKSVQKRYAESEKGRQARREADRRYREREREAARAEGRPTRQTVMGYVRRASRRIEAMPEGAARESAWADLILYCLAHVDLLPPPTPIRETVRHQGSLPREVPYATPTANAAPHSYQV